MKQFRNFFEVIGIAAFLSSCNSYVEKPQSDREMAALDSAQLSYERVHAEVFEPHCISCHGNSGGVNLETYAAVFQHRDAVSRTALTTRTMPKGSTLPQPAFQLLAAWLRAGAPEVAGGPAKADDPIPGPEPEPDPTNLIFQKVKEVVFAPRCIACHGTSGGISLETYSSVKENLSKIVVAALIDKTMPPSSPLTEPQAIFLKAWLKAGAPEGEVPVPDPLVPTFRSLKRAVFEPKCVACHSGGNPMGDMSFESLENLRKSPRQPLKMEDAGDPETSLLVMSLGHQPGAKPMPYPVGSAPLPGAELDVIREWIRQNAPE